MPDGWATARLGSLLSFQTGATFQKGQVCRDETKIRILRGGNIANGYYAFYKDDIFLDRELVSDSILLRKGDLITPAVTSLDNVGKIALVKHDYDDVSVGGFVFICRPFYNVETFVKYLLYTIQSPDFNAGIKSITKKSGSAFYNIGKERLATLPISVPPLAEQERIVKRVEELFAYIDTIDNNQAELEKLYDDLKKRVLDLAIQGKLVLQEQTDEPASVLLEKIRAEKKAKLGKKYVDSFIYKGDDNCYYEHIDGVAEDKPVEVPFDLPDGWAWTRVQDYVIQVTDFVASGSFATLRENVRYYKEENYALLIKTQDFANNFTKDLTYTDKKGYEFLSNSNIFGGELILSNVGSIGKVFIVPKMNRPATLAPNSIMVRCAQDIPVVWLYYLFQSPFGLQSLLTISSATAIQKFNKTDFKLLFIPVPPLAEQQRIVDKINEIFANL